MQDEPMSLEAATRHRLGELVGRVPFDDLRAHLARDAVFVVGPALAIVECGVRIAMNDVDAVQGFIARGELRKPSRGEREAWPVVEGRTWLALVVQPFVLVQDAAEA